APLDEQKESETPDDSTKARFEVAVVAECLWLHNLHAEINRRVSVTWRKGICEFCPPRPRPRRARFIVLYQGEKAIRARRCPSGHASFPAYLQCRQNRRPVFVHAHQVQ
ncbi:hypothetical protein GN958_ATG16947, partial [Phytophthora infestans]